MKLPNHRHCPVCGDIIMPNVNGWPKTCGKCAVKSCGGQGKVCDDCLSVEECPKAQTSCENKMSSQRPQDI